MFDYQKLVGLSPRFVYSEAKKIGGMPGLEGNTIRAAMQALNAKGVCQEKSGHIDHIRMIGPKRALLVMRKSFALWLMRAYLSQMSCA